ncbi:MAG: hypothetical protein Q8K92_12190 [Leadbetterella sp.]|nr:hypothetical protein [Leadbetterella sp.]
MENAQRQAIQIKPRKKGYKKIRYWLLGIFVVFICLIVLGAIMTQGKPLLSTENLPKEVNDSKLNLTGYNSKSNAEIKIYQNNNLVSEIQADKGGNFQADLILKEGENIIYPEAVYNTGINRGYDFKVAYIPQRNGEPQPDTRNETPQTNSDNQAVAEESEVAIKIPKYEITHEVKNFRYDGGVIYMVLISPVNLTSDNFKDDIKSIISNLVKEKGNKISVEIYDSKSILDLQYQSVYAPSSTRKMLSKSELEQLGWHNVASYAGQLETMPAGHELAFFPGTFTNDKKVGKFVGTMGFNPSN